MQTDLFKPYFNTTQVGYEKIKEYTRKAVSQDAEVVSIFQEYPDQEFTPFEVHAKLRVMDPKWLLVPITSIRRSITTLTRLGMLVKTDHKIIGQYGRLNYTWMLNA